MALLTAVLNTLLIRSIFLAEPLHRLSQTAAQKVIAGFGLRCGWIVKMRGAISDDMDFGHTFPLKCTASLAQVFHGRSAIGYSALRM